MLGYLKGPYKRTEAAQNDKIQFSDHVNVQDNRAKAKLLRNMNTRPRNVFGGKTGASQQSAKMANGRRFRDSELA